MGCTINKVLDYVLFLTRHFDRSDVESAILVLLLDLGFSAQMDGFHFLRAAILLRYYQSNRRFTKEIYPMVGEKVGMYANTEQVDSSIRAAIASACQNGDKEIWRWFFSDKNGEMIKPTNAEFISRIACILELWHKCCKEEITYVKR